MLFADAAEFLFLAMKLGAALGFVVVVFR